MRIGLVTACYKPVLNGVTRMVSLYKTHLEKAGHEVTIFTLGATGEGALQEPHVVRSAAWPLAHTGYAIAPRYNTAAQHRLAQMDILHCHHLVMSLEFAARYGRAPILYTNHTRYDLYANAYGRTFLPLVPEQLGQRMADALMRRAWPRLTNLADVVISPSASVAQIMRQFGVTRPLRVIENGIELEPFWHPAAPLSKADFGLAAENVLLIYVGRLAREKNIAQLLASFAEAHRQQPHLCLLLVGDGPLAAELPRRAAELGIGQATLFAGAIPFDDVPNYLAAADAFVTTSVSEVHPLTVIEAMAAGLPIVATTSPGIGECVPPEAGYLIAHPTELATAIGQIGSSAVLRHTLGRAAHAASHRYAIGRTVALTVELYEELLATRDMGRGTRDFSLSTQHSALL